MINRTRQTITCIVKISYRTFILFLSQLAFPHVATIFSVPPLCTTINYARLILKQITAFTSFHDS